MLIKMNYKEILIRGSLSRGVNRNSNKYNNINKCATACHVH